MRHGLMHLLVTTFVTPNGLSTYQLGHASQASSLFRATRFLTSMRSISNIRWQSVTVYLEVAEEFRFLEASIHRELAQMFPSLALVKNRLETPSQWRDALSKYGDDELILLNANDDHALVPGGDKHLIMLAKEIQDSQELQLGLVTHFPEFSGYLAREHLFNALSGGASLAPRATRTDNALGTTLVKASFAKSWFEPGVFQDSERIVRPDNPFGKSVRFDRVSAILSTGEVFRHLDGYSHVGLFRPVPPLRSTYCFDQDGFLSRTPDWSQGYWPARLATYAGKGVDIYLTDSPNGFFLGEVSIAMARLKLHWGLRPSLSSLQTLRLHPSPLSRKALFIGVALYAMTPSGFRAILDVTLDPILIILLRAIGPLAPSAIAMSNQIWALGTSRAKYGLKLARNGRSQPPRPNIGIE